MDGPPPDAIAGLGVERPLVCCGTLLDAVDAGVPLVVVPFGADQPVNAAAIERLGIGIVVDEESMTPQTIRDAVDSLVDVRSPHRQRLEALREDWRALPGPAEAAGAVIALAERGGSPRRQPTIHFVANFYPDQMEPLDCLVDAFNQEVDGLGDVELWIHTCWGNPNMQKVYTGRSLGCRSATCRRRTRVSSTSPGGRSTSLPRGRQVAH